MLIRIISFIKSNPLHHYTDKSFVDDANKCHPLVVWVFRAIGPTVGMMYVNMQIYAFEMIGEYCYHKQAACQLKQFHLIYHSNMEVPKTILIQVFHTFRKGRRSLLNGKGLR